MGFDGFYKVTSLKTNVVDGATKIDAGISIDPKHFIFEGHFPGLPVVPGVCMMRLVRELVANDAGSKLSMKEASNVKFLAVINPIVHPDVCVEIAVSTSGAVYTTTSRIYVGELTFFKMQAVFQTTVFA